VTPVPKRVLIVEDQRLIAADIEETLRKLGYEVVASVDSGEDAIAKAVALMPNLALMDVRLRGRMDGIQAAAAIRERVDIPVVYLTAYADEETVQRAMVTGPFGYLVKPFNERELRAAIEIAVYKHGTDRALAEERARRQAAEEFKLFVDGVEDYAIFLMDVGGRVISWNAGAERIKGYSSDEIIGRHFSIFYTPEDIAAGKPQAQLDLACREGRVEDEAWRVRKDGSRFWANVIVTARRGEAGQLLGFAKVTRDMTHRRQSEVALEEHVTRATAMIAAALDCVISIDAHGRVVEWNPASEQTFGYSRDEAVGQLMADLIVPERLRDGHREGLARYLKTQEGAILGKHVEMPAVTKDGRERIVELSIVRIPTGGPPIFTGFGRDVTDRRRAEAENAQLFQQAQDAVRARDEFLAIASHELRTPLSALMLQQAGLHKIAPDLPAKVAVKIEKAVKSTSRLSKLIDDLLDVSRITTGRLQLNPERVDMNDLLREVIDRFSEQALRAGSVIALNAEPQAEIIGTWDRMRIDQVLANLLSNAIKYGRGKPIEVSLAAAAEHVRLSVRDQGIGISADDIARIFGRFERAVPAGHYGGLGLGLYITRQIVEAHRGEIRVQSTPTAGSTFTVDLPRHSPTKVDDSNFQDAGARGLHWKNVQATR
jgi:PAS domain S-box-containing protein